MRRWLLFLGVLTITACGGGDGPRHTASPTASKPADLVAPSDSTPSVPSAFPTAPTSEPLSVPEASPLPTAAATRQAVVPTPAPVIPSGPLPLLQGRVTLGPAVSACVGRGLSVGEDGIVYTLGQRDGQPCASAIDPITGVVEPADPALVSPTPVDSLLEASDPTRGRVYVTEGSLVIAYDTDGQEIGPVLALPAGEPEGFSFSTALRLDETANRLYLSYQDFDGQAWLAMADLDTGETVADVPVPAGPWARCDALSACVTPRLFFADANTFVVLDGATLELINRLSLSRRPTAAVVDPAGGRLFVADAGGDLHVLDPTTMAELDRLTGVGASVDLDPQLGQLYAGDRYSGGVQVFDLATLEWLGQIPQPGQPVASPADARVYILEEGVYWADGVTLQLSAGRTVRNSGCNGCAYPTGVVVDPNSGLIHTATYGVWVGKPGPTSQAAVDSLTGRAFVARTTGGYQVAYSLAVFADLSLGEPLLWLDGLYGQPLYNPVSEQLYLAHGGRLLVLDGQTLEFLGGATVQPAPRDASGEALAQQDVNLVLFTVDGENGWLYGAQGEQLLRFSAQGAPYDAPGAEAVEGLPGPVYGIAVSPNFVRDATLLVRATDRASGRSDLYRSRDGGRSWVRLRGGLPGPPNDLVLAPDGRLYAALTATGWHAPAASATWGEGVYVSEDGGDTWRPDSQALAHLRVGRLHVDGEGTLYALAASAVEPGHAAGAPTIWTRELGQAWAPLAVPEAGPLRLVDYTIPTTYTLAVNAYWHALTGGGPLYQGWGDELRRSDDGGQTWYAFGWGPADYAASVVGGDDGNVYWLGPEALWRATDQGEAITAWAALRHPALEGGPPFVVVVADVDGAATLFLGSEAGQVLVVPAAEAEWEEPSSASAPTPVPATPSAVPVPEVCAIPPAASLAAVWEARLGCPTQPAEVHAMAYQPFEGGAMIWDGVESPTIYVGLSASGDWFSRPDQFQEGDPESDPTLTAPAGLLQPVRGFGRLWREDESVRQALGWALAAEVGFEGTWQVFEGGYALGSLEGRWWLFYFEGAPRWEEVTR